MKINSVRGIVIKANKVLMIYRENHHKKFYSIPGGKMEGNETEEETLVRELLEETSIKVKPLCKLGVFETPEKDQHVYICEYINGEPLLGNSVEKEKMVSDPYVLYRPEWVDLGTLLKYKVQPKVVASDFINYLKAHLDKKKD